MSEEEKTYLELSEEGDGSHKFYEVTVQDTTLTIRYGRIGDQGQSTTKTFPSAAQARAEAAKKIQEKVRKGYAPAVRGARQKRPVTLRAVDSQPSSARPAPVLWKFAGGSQAFGIFVDDRQCWIGNQRGQVFALGHDGQVHLQFQLPAGVKCIVGDDGWIYAGCDDGNVYDLSGKVPRLAYEIADNVDILWLDIWSGLLAVSDANGLVTLLDAEGDLLWEQDSTGRLGWMVRIDRNGVYHGHGNGVTAYDLDRGKERWHQKGAPQVLFGWQTEHAVHAGCADRRVRSLDKAGGNIAASYECDSAVMSNASTLDGRWVFAGDSASSVYCFDARGQRLWKLGTDCGSALSMQFHQDRLYLVTTEGYMVCLDLRENAIRGAEGGKVPKVREIQAPKGEGVTPSAEVETTAASAGGVVVECVEEGGRLRMHPLSAGYRKDWNVQFPKDVRQKGARYVVEGLRESARGGFYRAYGEIKKLV
jgi:predicted DNA-binding WGR domain protein